MRFIHIADVHLGAIPDGNKPWANERAQELYDTFSEVIDACNAKAVDLLLISGDLFHRQPLKRELKEIAYMFGKLRQTQVVLMAGNHDYLRSTSYYKNFPWDEHVHFFYNRRLEPIYFAHLDTEVWGLSYYEQKITENLYDSVMPQTSDTYRILLAHGGDDTHIPFRKDRLLYAGFQYIAFGHLHQPQLRFKDHMAYAGSLEPLCDAETGAHGYILGEITEEGTTFELIPVAKRQYIPLTLCVTTESTIGSLSDQLKDLIAANGEKNLYLLTMTGRFDPNARLDYSKLETCGNIVRITDKTQPDYDILALSHEHAGDLIGKYMEALHKMPPSPLTSKALNYGLSALLSE